MGQDPAGSDPAADASEKMRKKGSANLTKQRISKGWKTVTSTEKIVKEPQPTHFSAKPSNINFLEKYLLEISDYPCYNKEEFQRKAIVCVFDNVFGSPEKS